MREILGYKIGDKIYHPADVWIICKAELPPDPWIPLDPDGLPPETYPQWRRDEIRRRAAAT